MNRIRSLKFRSNMMLWKLKWFKEYRVENKVLLLRKFSKMRLKRLLKTT